MDDIIYGIIFFAMASSLSVWWGWPYEVGVVAGIIAFLLFVARKL